MNTRSSNPNNRRRTLDTGRVRRVDPSLPTGADVAAAEANHAHRVSEAEAAERLSRRHILEVRRYMPYLRECKKTGKSVRRVPKKVLDTVAQLCLV